MAMIIIKQQKRNNTNAKLLAVIRRRRRTAALASTAGRRRHGNYSWEEKFKVKLVVLKREMEEMSKHQESIGIQQMEIRKKIEDFRDKCAEIRHESEQIIQKQASNQVLLQFICNILRARNNGGDES